MDQPPDPHHGHVHHGHPHHGPAQQGPAHHPPAFWWRWWAWLLAWWRRTDGAGRSSRQADTATAPGLSLRQRAALLGRRDQATPAAPPDVWLQAQALVRAIDAGGLPLNPARVNAIARGLGLEVSAQAPMDQTVARIRAALQRPRH